MNKRKRKRMVVTGALLMLLATTLWLLRTAPGGFGPLGQRATTTGAAESSQDGLRRAIDRNISALEQAPASRAEQGPRPPTVKPGDSVEVQLSEPPARWYMRGESGGNERFYRRLTAELAGKDALYSADLGRAAREFVFQHTELGVQPPTEVRDFLIAASGAVAGDTAFHHVRTNSETEKSLRKAISGMLEEPPDGVGPLTLGIGEVFTPGARLSRHIGIVVTRSAAVLESLPRRVELDSPWLVKGRMLADFRDLHALVLRPGETAQEVKIERTGDRFRIVAMSGKRAGVMLVQLLGVGSNGPGKVIQVSAVVGKALPDRIVVSLPPDESEIQDADDAASFAFALLNGDRQRHGKLPLRWDKGLAVVARHHSKDMRDEGFFSHLSATTGLHGERLERAGYRAVRSSENLALNVSIYEAEQGLMHSLGHRRNILDSEVTHVGIGVVGEDRAPGSRRWWVTQLFARPVRRIDAAVEAERILSAINVARDKVGLPAVVVDSSLSQVAEGAAESASTGAIEGVSQAALDEAKRRGLVRGRLRSWVATTPEVERLKLPELLGESAVRRLGIGVAQQHLGDGTIAVVLLASN